MASCLFLMQGSDRGSSVRSSTDVMGPTLASISKQKMGNSVSNSCVHKPVAKPQ